MGTVSELSALRKPDAANPSPRVWLLKDKDMTFTGTDGELVATLRFEDPAGGLYARLTTAEGFCCKRIRCGQALRLVDMGLLVVLLAVERRNEAWRLLLEFHPLGAAS